MSKRGNPDVPGNALASQALMDRQMIRHGVSVVSLQDDFYRLENQDIHVKRLSFTYRDGVEGGVLGVLTADSAEGPIVAFQPGSSLIEAIDQLGKRIRNGRLDWKQDRPYNAG